jgi:AraC-like DNA-binding protein
MRREYKARVALAEARAAPIANRTLSVVRAADSLCKTPQNKIIDQATKTLIDKLLLEKISLAGIARVVGISEPWL